MSSTEVLPKKSRQVTTKNVYKKLFDAEVSHEMFSVHITYIFLKPLCKR